MRQMTGKTTRYLIQNAQINRQSEQQMMIEQLDPIVDDGSAAYGSNPLS